MIEIVDYQDKYAKLIDDMVSAQWSNLGNSIRDYACKKSIIRVALCNGDFAGVAYGQLIKEFFWLNAICLLPKYQKLGIGSMLMSDIISKAASKFNISKIEAESVLSNGKSNSKKLLENSGFVLKGKEERFWGKKHPDAYCNECNKKPCECVALFYEKLL